MEHLKFCHWLLNEEDSAYLKKIKALINAFNLQYKDDLDGTKAAGNVPIESLTKDVIDNFKSNTIYIDASDEDKIAIDDVLSKPNSKVGDLARTLASISNG